MDLHYSRAPEEVPAVLAADVHGNRLSPGPPILVDRGN